MSEKKSINDKLLNEEEKIRKKEAELELLRKKKKQLEQQEKEQKRQERDALLRNIGLILEKEIGRPIREEDAVVFAAFLKEKRIGDYYADSRE